MTSQLLAENKKGCILLLNNYTKPSIEIRYFDTVAAADNVSGPVTNAAIDGNTAAEIDGSAAARTVRLQTIISLNRGGD